MLFLERLHPYILAIAAGIAWYSLALPFPRDEKEFLAAALSFGAIFTGFMATAQAILMALPSDTVMAQLKTSGYIETLIEYIATAIYGAMFFCVVNIAGFFLLKESTRLPLLYSTLWIVLAAFTVFTFVRVVRIMLKIMRH